MLANTRQPRAANRSAAARPMPDELPVMRTVRVSPPMPWVSFARGTPSSAVARPPQAALPRIHQTDERRASRASIRRPNATSAVENTSSAAIQVTFT